MHYIFTFIFKIVFFSLKKYNFCMPNSFNTQIHFDLRKSTLVLAQTKGLGCYVHLLMRTVYWLILRLKKKIYEALQDTVYILLPPC